MRELKPCGTRAAYVRHQRHGEEVDEACRLANSAYALKGMVPYSRAKQRAFETFARAHAEEFSALLKAERDAERPSGTAKRKWTNLTRQRALRALAANHPDDFAALLAAKRGRLEEEAANV